MFAPTATATTFPSFHFFLFLLLLIYLIGLSFSSSPTSSPSSDSSTHLLCSHRCHRLLRRSLNRIDQNLDVSEVLYRIGIFRRDQLLSGQVAGSSEELAPLPAGEFQDICWKFFDFEGCQKQCQKLYRKRRRKRRRGLNEGGGVKWKKQRKEQQQQKQKGMTGIGILPEHQAVLHSCRRADLGVPLEQFACVHKYHTFMEVHCSTYQQRMVELRLVAKQLQQENNIDAQKLGGAKALARLTKAVEQELCLRVHQLSTCLVNAGQRYCPQLKTSRPIVTRSSLREHFLSILLPFGRVIDLQLSNRGDGARNGDETAAEAEGGEEEMAAVGLDQLFPDTILDRCQLFDFHRMAKEWMMMEKPQGEEEERRRGKKGEEQGEEGGWQQLQRSTTKRAILVVTGDHQEADGGLEVTIAPSHRRVFSSEEDLDDVPPNFYYSTARLPKDFYNRYAIWWGGRRPTDGRGKGVRHSYEMDESSGEFTAVHLLPTDFTPPAYTQLISSNDDENRQRARETTRKWEWDEQQEEVPATFETHPDSMPTTTSAVRDNNGASADAGWSVTTMPYFVNGQVTWPREKWPNEGNAGAGGRTEIRLMSGVTEQMSATATTDGTTTKEGEEQHLKKGPKRVVEEYEEEWAYEDEFESSEFEGGTTMNDGTTYAANSAEADSGDGTLPKPANIDSSRVEELIKEIGPDANGNNEPQTVTSRHRDQSLRTPIDSVEEDSGGNSANNGNSQPPLYTTTTEAGPLFRETNIYFAKILDFSQEPPDDPEWLQKAEEAAATAVPAKTIAHMFHFPGDQLPIVVDDHSRPAQLEPDEVTTVWSSSGEQHRGRQQKQQQQMPMYTIVPADPNNFLMGPREEEARNGMRTTTTSSSNRPMDVRTAWRSGTPTKRPVTGPSKILISAEPVPTKKSETLLVLLGIYLTFFAVASFLLFCLVLACLERHRRGDGRRQNAKASTGSAILYLDSKKGTVKEVI